MHITENLAQRNRHPPEKARQIQYLKLLMKDNDGIDNMAKWISSATKMSERNVYRYDKLASQPKDVQEAVDKGEITVKQAIGEIECKKENPKLTERLENEIRKQAIKINKHISLFRKIKDDNGVSMLDEESKRHLKEAIAILKELLAELIN